MSVDEVEIDDSILDATVTTPEQVDAAVELLDVVEGAVEPSAEEVFFALEAVDELEATIADEQGLRGAPGRDGAPGGKLARECLTAVTGGQALRADGPDYVRPASALVPEDAFAIVGVAYHGASPGDVVELVALGQVEDSSWSFVANLPVFVGPTGLLTQTVLPGFAFVRPCGVATSPTTVFVDLSTPIFLAQG